MSPARLIAAVLFDAYNKFNRDDGWAIASHVALSSLLAMFPFLIFATSIAGFLELGGFADTVTHLIFDYWPEEAAQAIAPEVERILTTPRADTLTFGGLLTLYFASNGVEALRVALNRSYRQADARPFWRTRLQSLFFVFASILVLMAITFLLILLPLGLRLAEKWTGSIVPFADTLQWWRLVVAFCVILAGLLAAHLYLPAGRRPVSMVLPGILFTLMSWFAGSLLFGAYLESFADYASTYAGLAGAMIGLIFLYMLGVIFILGAEINSALMARIAPRNAS